MEFYDVVRDRHSVRSYEERPVEREKLDRILEAARLAPTAVNKQPFRLYVIETTGREADLGTIYSRGWFVQAPLVIGITCLRGLGWIRRDGKDFGDIDTAIVMDHLILAAASEGLGTCWIGAFDAAAAARVLDLGKDEEPIAFTPLGYPEGAAPAKKRKLLEELVVFVGDNPDGREGGVGG